MKDVEIVGQFGGVGKLLELSKIRADLGAKEFGSYTINNDTIEAMYSGDNIQCLEGSESWIGLDGGDGNIRYILKKGDCIYELDCFETNI